jgi:hypothetical protein
MSAQAKLLEQVRARLAEDPEHVAPLLQLIADPDAIPVRAHISEQARQLNVERLVDARARLAERALRGDEVRRLLGGISRQALHQRVRGGRLLAMRWANTSYFPDWQFVAGAPHPRLAELLAELPADPLAADRLMRAALPEEDGRSAADLLAAGDAEAAVHYARTAGGDR